MKKTGLIICGILIFIIVCTFGWGISTYNNFQQSDETVNNNWAQIQNQLLRRNDLIPNLVNTVKGYATHEKTVYTNIADARAKLAGAVSKGDVKSVSKA